MGTGEDLQLSRPSDKERPNCVQMFMKPIGFCSLPFSFLPDMVSRDRTFAHHVDLSFGRGLCEDLGIHICSGISSADLCLHHWTIFTSSCAVHMSPGGESETFASVQNHKFYTHGNLPIPSTTAYGLRYLVFPGSPDPIPTRLLVPHTHQS